MPHANGQLTAEEIEPSAEDLAEGRRLVAEGWRSVSNKFRILRRFKPGVPSAREMILPEWRNTPFGKELENLWRDNERFWLRTEHLQVTEEMTCTVRIYRAFRLAGGESA